MKSLHRNITSWWKMFVNICLSFYSIVSVEFIIIITALEYYANLDEMNCVYLFYVFLFRLYLWSKVSNIYRINPFPCKIKREEKKTHSILATNPSCSEIHENNNHDTNWNKKYYDEKKNKKERW